MPRAHLRIWLVSVLLVALPGVARSAGTANVIHRGEAFLEGTMKGVALDAEGRLSPALWRSEEWKTPAAYIWCLALDSRGRWIAGSGDSGVIYRQEGNRLKEWASTPAFEILSLLTLEKDVIAGTGTEGVVYRIDPKGTVHEEARLPEQTVWSLAPRRSGHGWLAGTGPVARLYAGGEDRVEKLAEFPATNLMDLLRDAKGLWIATQGPGLLYRIEGEDHKTPRLVFEAADEEIRRVVSDGDGGVYLLTLAQPEDSSASSDPNGSPTPRSRIVWLPEEGGQEEIYRSKDPLLSLVRLSDGTLLAGEGQTGRLHHVDPARGKGVVWGDLEGADPLVLAIDDEGSVVVGTGNPGSVFLLQRAARHRGEYTSAVVETPGSVAWGRVQVESEGQEVRVQTRSGVRAQPDSSWSAWSPEVPPGTVVGAPIAPYLQYRLLLGGGKNPARVSAVRLSWRERNLAPRIREIRVEGPEAPLYPGGVNGNPPSPVSQRFDDGLTVEYSIYPDPDRAEAERSAWARGIRTLRWSAEDPNGDRLRYRVQVRPERGGNWYTLGEDLKVAVFAWDTRSFPDGPYRIRVRADDSLDNPVGGERSREEISGLILVDNTPPKVSRLEWADRTQRIVRGEVLDEGSPLVSLSIRQGEGEWRPVQPEDQVLEGPHERFEVALPDGDGDEQPRIWLRVVDAAGNTTVRELLGP